ncbi:hypothetical protein GGR54DRAFT_653479 [Hypoxylon sp. NC1633]|nr:hypothetical protein GGR54DRAFT_653479 [Hypoxylon sp. NC1633]
MIAGSSLLLLIVVLIARAISADDSQQAATFLRPSNAPEKPNRDYSTNPVWRVGGTELIRFTTTHPNYTINLGQRRSNQVDYYGPPIFQTQTGVEAQSEVVMQSGAETEIRWSVQVLQLDLQWSNVFFLWLAPLDKNGDISSTNSTSRYFNITTSFQTSPLPSPPQPTMSPTTSTTPPTSSATTTAADNSTLAPTEPREEGAGSLSAGAQAAIGTSVALLGLAAVASAAFYSIRRRRRRQTENNYDDKFKILPEEEEGPKAQLPLDPVELDADSPSARLYYLTVREPVELG